MTQTRRKQHTSTPRARVGITLNGERFVLRAPKKFRIMQMQGMAEEQQAAFDAAQADPTDAAARGELVRLMNELTAMIASLFFDDDATKTRESSRARFMAALEDDDNDLDLDDAEAIISLVVEATQGNGQAGPSGKRPTK